MYTIVLFLHSWLRWGVIVAGVLATYAALTGDARRQDATGLLFMIALDLQMLLGLLLYLVLSPTTAAIFNDFPAAMRDPVARFWAVEHVGSMLLAVVAVHVGRVLARKAATPAARQSRLLWAFSLALILILFETPWPGLRAGRPLFRV